MHRILHIGAGPLGQRILSELHERRLGRVVGLVDPAPNLEGRTLADLVPAAAGAEDGGVRVAHDLSTFRAWESVDAAVVTTSSDLRLCVPTFRALLERGLPVVSTCEELVWPWLRHAALARDLDDMAKRHGGRLLGTGVNPGFLMDALPSVLTGVCKSVHSVRVWRVQDASSRRVPFQKKIGAGLDDEHFQKRVQDGSLRHVGLGESLHFVAHCAGLTVERWEEDIAPVHADRDLTCALGPIPRGRVAGVRQSARAYADERCVIHLEFQAAIGQADPHERIVIDGEPPVDAVIRGGVHGDLATSALVLNALPRVLGAAPGLHTMASIPPVVHRASGGGR
jgi:4-hydroxy-tetrahydrodipicolinate reductase